MNWHKGTASTVVTPLKQSRDLSQQSLLDRILRIRSRVAGQLGLRELRRRMWHMMPGFLPFVLWGIPHRDPISPTLRVVAVAIIAGLGLRILWGFRLIRRHSEQGEHGMGAVMGYALSVLACLLLFPAQAEISLGVLGILAFGDGSATLVGLMWRGKPLPWNTQKSWPGLFAFIGIGTFMSALIYWGETHNLEAMTPGVSFPTALLCTALATVPAAIAESLPLRINDNIRVGVTAAIGLAAAHGWLIGWAG